MYQRVQNLDTYYQRKTNKVSGGQNPPDLVKGIWKTIKYTQ